MEQVFKFIKQSRQAFIHLINELTIEQLNEIPAGFNNNIIWNFGHIVIATQALSYVRTGIRPDASSITYASAYAKGTKPTYFVTQEEVDELKKIAVESIEQIEKDYAAGVFNTITPFATDTYKETMPTFEEVITLTSGHDNLHYGYAIAQKRIINNNK
jgi:hypothetical protein